jgi:hypothetical protein
MRTIPKRDKDCLAFAKNLLAKCTENAPNWDITAADLQEFKDLLDPADKAVDANANLQTRNKESTAHKNGAMKLLVDNLRAWVRWLRANKKISNSELAEMGLQLRDYHHHAPKPRPNETAVLTARVTHLAIKVFASVPQGSHPTQHVTRPGYHGLYIRWRAEGGEWMNMNTTRTTATLKFAPEQVGKIVEIIAAWVNPRLQPGPWGESIRVLVR